MAGTLRRAVVVAAAAAATGAAGEGSVSMSMDASQSQLAAAVPLYDCSAEYDVWQTAWSPDWKAWCCENEGRGCPSTTTTTATSTTRTSSTSTQTSSTSSRTSTQTTTSKAPKTTTTKARDTAASACEATCELKGVVAKCNERIAWSTIHETADEKAPCEAAHVLVISQCQSCSNCTAKLAGCHDEGKDFLFKKKLQQKFAASSLGAEQASVGSFAAFAGLAAFAAVGALAAGVAAVRRRSSQERSGARGIWLAMEEEADEHTAGSANE